MKQPRLGIFFWAGLILIGVSEGFVLCDVLWRGGLIVSRPLPATAMPEPTTPLGLVARWFAINMTALCWLGYLGVFDGLGQRIRRGLGAASAPVQGEGSPIRERPNRFVVAWLTSIPVWCLFDTINFYFLDAWRYHGLPGSFASRLIGYFIAFAAISPGMFLAAEIWQRLGLRRAVIPLSAASALSRHRFVSRSAWSLTVGPPMAIALIVIGLLVGREDMLGQWLSIIGSALLLLGPGLAALVRHRTRSMTAFAFGVSFVLWTCLAREPIANFTLWVGLIYLLDPINKLLEAPSLLRDWEAGRFGRTLALGAGGATCGLLWEFWNYWAIAKWTYHLPFLGPLEQVRYFEMPVLGFLGFLPFAAECWVMLNTIILLLRGARLYVAEPLPHVDSII